MRLVLVLISLATAVAAVSCARLWAPAEGAASLVPGSTIPVWPVFPPEGRDHYVGRVQAIAKTPVERGGLLFVGDSITEGGDWARRFPNVRTSNHGVGWDSVEGLKARLPQVTRGAPDKVFLKIGTNDFGYEGIGYRTTPEKVAQGIAEIVREMRAAFPPSTEIYVQSVLPREAAQREHITALNRLLAIRQPGSGYVFLDLYPHFVSVDGSLDDALSDDELHLNETGYQRWATLIEPCVRARCAGVPPP